MLAEADRIIDVLHTVRQIVDQRDPRNVELLRRVIEANARSYSHGNEARWALSKTTVFGLDAFETRLVPRRAKRDTLRLLDRTVARLQREQRAARAVSA